MMMVQIAKVLVKRMVGVCIVRQWRNFGRMIVFVVSFFNFVVNCHCSSGTISVFAAPVSVVVSFVFVDKLVVQNYYVIINI